MRWDNPEPGIFEAFRRRCTDVVLEVYVANDDDPDEHAWWALSEGRVIAAGTAGSLAEAKRQAELASVSPRPLGKVQ